MKVERAQVRHIAEAQGWNAARGGLVRPEVSFSDTGFVVDGVAAVWLYLTNSSIAYLDYLASNPDAAKDEREFALDAVIVAAMSHAQSCGMSHILTFVDLPAVRARGERLGFVAGDKTLTMLVRPLGDS